MNIYDFSATSISGEELPLQKYKGKAMLIVNTASKCGFTPQYQGLQQLYDKFQDDGLVVLGFPSNQFMNQEPGSEETIQTFCEVNYGVTFPLFSKIDVKGKNAHPLFAYLSKQAPGILSGQIKWNFTKFLVDKDGHVVKRYAPSTKPESIETDIQQLLSS
ncbi:redoxin domain-containing protein [Sediminibacillus dalangtanensis]|uniref:Glutathione peroxidase n=1 Tax=Sediminibacillus dalangtanensis TaxID=2729421 RepID=A0ABX7VMN8_9BACI|nr:glutathione peroxidase [Sediminibacillus dalangtanensis]QTM98074.1 redoxin domain-containing protein [Sediminibacillus dalangtanensis]